MTYEDAKAEAAYIAAVDPRNPGRTFNYLPSVFARYCNMQANTIARAGFPLVAHDILQARDIADPDFREYHRARGWAVRGVWCAEKHDFLPPESHKVGII